jgi:hypothetical protein
MPASRPLSWQGTRYAFVRGRDATEAGRVLSSSEATRILRLLIASEACGQLRSLYQELSHSPTSTPHPNEVVVEGLIQRLGDHVSGWRLIELTRNRRRVPTSSESPEQQEERALDRKLAELGTREDLFHDGRHYRLVRAARNEDLPGRRHYEAVNTREAQRLLSEMAQDTQQPERQRALLEELQGSIDATQTNPNLALVLLRRYRVYILTQEKAEVITPAQMRRMLEEHWIEVELIDDAGIPLVGEVFSVITPDGRAWRCATDARGLFRIDRIPAGDCKLQLASSDLLEGPDSHGHLDLELVDPAGLPLAGMEYDVLAGGTSVAKGKVDETGRAHLGGLPPGPYELVLPGVAVNAATLDGAEAHAASGSSREAKTYVVKKGDTLNKIAQAHGVKTGRELYDAPENEALRKKRPNPDRIRVGDEVNIPSGEVAAFDLSDGQVARVVVGGASAAVPLTLRLLGSDDKALAGAYYQLSGAGFFYAGELGADGVLKHELPPGTEEARLVIVGKDAFMEQTLVFQDEQDDVTSDQIRLANLGWYGGAIDGQSSALLASAIGYYKRSNNLGAGNEMEDATRQHVEQEYLA